MVHSFLFRDRLNLEKKSLSEFPGLQRNLNEIEREQKASEELYTFLLKKKAEAEEVKVEVEPEAVKADESSAEDNLKASEKPA